jgi:hypothetical protein
MSTLTDDELAMLDFEAGWWKYAGAKDQAIREKFDLTTTRYYQRLNALINRPEAIQQRPLIVKWLRRIRDHKQRQRAGRRIDPYPT